MKSLWWLFTLQFSSAFEHSDPNQDSSIGSKKTGFRFPFPPNKLQLDWFEGTFTRKPTIFFMGKTIVKALPMFFASRETNQRGSYWPVGATKPCAWISCSETSCKRSAAWIAGGYGTRWWFHGDETIDLWVFKKQIHDVIMFFWGGWSKTNNEPTMTGDGKTSHP